MARVEARARERERGQTEDCVCERERACQVEQFEERVAHKKWRFPTQANREKIAGRGSRPQPGPACLPLVCVCVSESGKRKNLKKNV